MDMPNTKSKKGKKGKKRGKKGRRERDDDEDENEPFARPAVDTSHGEMPEVSYQKALFYCTVNYLTLPLLLCLSRVLWRLTEKRRKYNTKMRFLRC